MNASAIISLRDITKSYGPVPAVREASFDIQRGEFFSLLGPSGCGKTTLLRMIGGFERPSSGDILIDGESMDGLPPDRRPTNMVFQNYAIFPHLTVRQNVGYGLLNRKLDRGEADRRISALLEMIQMSAYGDRMPNQLSGGQRQRVALARALICEPKVLLLDEPLGALDKKLRSDMQMELRRLQKQVGITFVLVTHDQEEALTLSDRIAVLESGRVLQVGDGTTLYERPRSRAVAGFIGTMNFFDATAVAGAGGECLADAGPLGQFAINGSGLTPGTPLSLAIRPEKIALNWVPPEIGRSLKGTVVGDSYLGDRRHYCVELPGLATPLWVSEQISHANSQFRRTGDPTVWLSWPDDALIVLDSD